jgi:hypothetical protein
MARIDRDGNLILEIAIAPDRTWTSAEQMYREVRDAAEVALLEALANPDIQDYMELVMDARETDVDPGDSPGDDGEINDIVDLMN